MKTLRIIGRSFLFLFLTALTQVGGIVYLLSFVLDIPLRKFFKNRIGLWVTKLGAFLTLYALVTFLLIPPLARSMDRVPLPLTETNHLRPLNFLTCLLNRHYVTPQLKDISLQVADDMAKKYPGSTLSYLDANFPFIDKFPLIPHLSHNDGKKLDLAFCYSLPETDEIKNGSPSWIGYGVCEEPKKGEKDTPSECDKKHWQYSLLTKIVPQGGKENYTFNNERTKYLVELYANQPAIGKIFIEPHLKTRLRLNHAKVRFHGCHAVRHDDHIHVQLY